MTDIPHMPDKLLITSEPWVDLYPMEWLLGTPFGYSKVMTDVHDTNKRITECLYDQAIWELGHYFNAARELVQRDPVEDETVSDRSYLDFRLRNSEQKTYAIVDPFTMDDFLKYDSPSEIGFIYIKAANRDNKAVTRIFNHIESVFESRSYLQGLKFRGMTIDEYTMHSMYFMSRSLWRAPEHD